MADTNRRRLNQNELAFISEYEIEDNDRSVYKAVPTHMTGDLTDLIGSSQIQRKQQAIQPPTLPKAGLGLMNIALLPQKGADALWQVVSSVVKGLPNTDPIFDDNMKRTIGNFYQHGNYCEFLLGLYTVEESPVVDFKRMSGDGFVMDAFFRAVQSGLAEKGVTEAVPEESEDDLTDFYSDNDTDDEDLDFLKPGGYLQLKYDPKLVNSWINKMKSRHIEDQNHMMGLMAHNAGNAANLDIMVKQGGNSLCQLCTSLLEESMNAALARNTSVLVRELSTKVEFDSKFLEALFVALQQWVPNNGRKKQFEITESREATLNLVQTLHNLKSMEDEMRNQLESLDAEDIDNVTSYLNTLEQNDNVSFVLSLLG